MAELTKQALRVENNTEFPNNNNGQITPSRLRTFNEDMIDSTVNQAQYTTDSGSWNQQIDALESFSSSLDTNFASQAEFNSYTSSNNQRVSSLEAATSSYATSAITASSLITASFAAGTLTFTKGDATTFGVVIPDVSGSAIETGSFATTGSNTFVGNQTITGSVTISGSAATDLTVAGTMIVTGSTAGARTTIDSGSIRVTNSPLFSLINPGNGIFSGFGGTQFQQIALENEEGTIILSVDANGSYIRDYNPTLGDYSNAIKFQPYSNYGTGQIQILRNLQITGSLGISGNLTSSLQQGYVWVGDAAGRTTTVATSSFGSTINTGSFATTGSNIFVGNQTITGSLFISSSGGLGLSNTNGGNVQYFGNSFGSNIGIYKASDATEIGFAMDGAQWTTNWGNGPIIYVNNTPGDTYEGVFGFQNKTNYTDGRITALKPLDVRGNTTITGSLTVSSSAATDLAVIGNSVFTGNTTITGSTPSLTIRGTAGVTTQFSDSLSISSSLYRNLQGSRGIEFLKSGFDYNTFLASYTALSSSFLLNFTDNLSATASYTVGVFDNAFTQDVELSLETTTTNGILFKDIRSDTGAYTTFLKIAPNGGSNPPLEFKRGMQITGSLSIQSGSALPVSTGSAILTWNASTGQVTQAPFSSILSASVSSGEFWSTTTQSGSAGVSGSIQFNNSGSFYNTSVVNGTQLQVANPGVYNIQFSAQIETSAGADTLWVWFKKNGNNIGASASKAVLANNTAQIMTVNILDEAVANDYYEVAYQNLNGHATILAEAASGNIPAIPSVIVTIFQIR